MSDSFQPGDDVQLKSGGPRMTVSEVHPNGKVECEWFDMDDKPQARTFPSETLKEWQPPGIG